MTDKIKQLGTEEDTDTEPITIDKQEEPISFREAIKFSNGNITLELYSSSIPVDVLSSIIIELNKELYQSKKGKSYLG